MQRTTVDPALCIGCALCAASCPNSYDMGEDGLSTARAEQTDSMEALEASITDCPVGAISSLPPDHGTAQSHL